MLPSPLLITMAGYTHCRCRRRVSHQRSINLLQIEPDIELLSAVKPTPLEGVGLQGPGKAILLYMHSK